MNIYLGTNYSGLHGGSLFWWKCLANRGLRGVVAHRAMAVSPVSLINPLNRTRICRVIEGNIMSALTMASQCGAQPELICPRVAAFDHSSIYMCIYIYWKLVVVSSNKFSYLFFPINNISRCILIRFNRY